MNSEYNLKTILKFTIPLAFSTLSMQFMFTVNRMVLAYYSVDSMNAAALAGNFVAVINFTLISVSQIATVFVGQYNGAGEIKKLGRPVWQMIYLCLISFLIFVPLSLYSENINTFPEYFREEGVAYQKILLMFAALPAIVCALSSFFIGTGKSNVIISVVIIGNIIDIVLSIVLVFGVDGLFPALGCRGAAIATVASEIAQIVILGFIFFNKKNREMCNTSDYIFRKSLFFDCIRTGLPVSIGKFLDMLAWFMILLIFSYVSKDLATLESIAVSLYFVFIFFSDGAGKAVSSLSANLIGKNNIEGSKKLLNGFLKLNAIACLIFSIPLVFYQDSIFFFLNEAKGSISHLKPEFQFLFISMWSIIFTDGIFYVICGILTAGGDTKFPMYVESISAWLFVVIPAVIMYYNGTLTTIRVIYTILSIRSALNAFIMYKRYKTMKWFNKLV